MREELSQIWFGKAKWERFFGDVGVEPPLPKDIVEVLKSPCPYWGGKRIEETHMLVLIPQTVNGRPLTLNMLQELIQSPQGGGSATQYGGYNSNVKNEHGDQSVSKSYWALITKDVLPNSRNKTYAEQQALIKGPYAVPGALETATGILMHHAQTAERLYSDNPQTYTRCQETLSNGYRVVVGSFGSSGLGVINLNDDYRFDRLGLGDGPGDRRRRRPDRAPLTQASVLSPLTRRARRRRVRGVSTPDRVVPPGRGRQAGVVPRRGVLGSPGPRFR